MNTKTSIGEEKAKICTASVWKDWGNNETKTKRSLNSPSCHRGPDPCNSQLGCFSVCGSSKHERRRAKAAIPGMDIFTLCLCALLHLHWLRLVVCFSLPWDLGDPRKKDCAFRYGAWIILRHANDLGDSIVLAHLSESCARHPMKTVPESWTLRSDELLSVVINCGVNC